MDAYLTAIVRYLATQSWQIAALTIAVAVATIALRRRSAHVRYLLWLIVLAKCLVPPLYAVPLAVVPEGTRVDSLLMPAQSETVGGRSGLSNATSPDSATPELRESGQPAPNASASSVWSSASRRLGSLWLLGAGIYLGMNLLRAVRGHWWLRRSRRALPDNAAVDTETLSSAYGVRRLPGIWIVDDVGQPFVWGLLRGNIYVPATFLAIRSAEHRRDILGHELSHVLRLDAAVNSLQVIAQAIFWFHPFVWWANRKIRQEREKCCDEMAVARLGTPAKDYCNAVVEALVDTKKSTRPVPSLAVAGPARNIQERIKTMLIPGKRFHKDPGLVAVTATVLIALLVVPTALVLAARGATEATDKTEVPSTATLNDAASKGDIERVKQLIAGGADVNAYSDGWTPLLSAAWNGHKQVVEILLEHGADINARTEGWTALHNAACLNQWDIAKLLMARGAKPETGLGQNGYGSAVGATALHIAAHYGRFEVVNGLLAEGVDINIRDQEGNTPLHEAAAWSRYPKMIKLLIDKGADVNSKNKTGRIPLHGAPLWRGGTTEKVDLLIAHGSDVRAADQDGWTPLHMAALSGLFKPVQLLIDKGADVNAETTDGRKPLDEAARVDEWDVPSRDRVRVADLLLKSGTKISNIRQAAYAGNLSQVRGFVEQGVNVNARHPSGLTPLHTAASGGHTQVIAYLIAQGADVNQENNVSIVNGRFPSGRVTRDNYSLHCKTPLHYAAAGHAEAAEMLIAHGAKVNGIKDGGWTPLHDAAWRAQKDVVKVLLDNGAEVDIRGGVNRRTPLSSSIETGGDREVIELLISRGAAIDQEVFGHAVMWGHKGIVDLLIAKGANADEQIGDSGGPVHWAAQYNRKEIMEILLAKGADCNIKRKDGKTALVIAQDRGHTEIVDLLRKHGAQE